MAAALLLAAALLQDPPRSVEAFRAAFAAAGDDLARAEAFARLPAEPDERVVDLVAPLLAGGSEPIRLLASDALGRQKGSVGAAAALLEAVPRQPSVAIKSTLLREVGRTGFACEALAKELALFLRDPDLEVGRAAAEACGKIGGPTLVMPLILRLAEAEAAVAETPPAKAGPVTELRDACRRALLEITRQELPSAQAYAEWWKANRPKSS
jgi:HEAT repeat protein